MRKIEGYVIVNWVEFYMAHLVIHKSFDNVAVDERDVMWR
jgi:hypothetical protein